MKTGMLIQLMVPLNQGKRVRRKSWRDSGKYLMSPHDDLRNPIEAKPSSCYQYFIGSGESVLWIETGTEEEIRQEVIAKDWEVMTEPDYEAFGRDIWKWAKKNGAFEEGFNEDPDSFLHVAKKHSLVDLVPFDPEKHHDVGHLFDGEEGDMIWYLTNWDE